MSTEAAGPAFTMLGSADAMACEGDFCAVPTGAVASAAAVPAGAVASAAVVAGDTASVDIEPPADEAAAASSRAVTAALDEGSSL